MITFVIVPPGRGIARGVIVHLWRPHLMGAFPLPLVCLTQPILPLPLSPTHTQFFEQPLASGVGKNGRLTLSLDVGADVGLLAQWDI